MKHIFIVLIFVSLLSHSVVFGHRYGERHPYGYGSRREAPVWHDSGLFEERDLMNSLFYGAFGFKMDRVHLDGVTLNTYGAYIEYCNIMLSGAYRQKSDKRAYDASASFLIPFHPNFRFGPRLEYAGTEDRTWQNGYNNKFTVGVTIDLHFRYVSIVGNVSPRSIGFGVGWAFGRL